MPAPKTRRAHPTALLALLALPACDDGDSTTTSTTSAPTDSDCPDYLQFCVTADVTGSLTADATAGYNHRNIPCAEWAAAGPTRILELPGMNAAGPAGITIALTRIGEYTGPGTYELQPSTMTGNPDAYPAIDVDSRFFTNNTATTTTITISSDGSGTLTATALAETESLHDPDPDPNARIDLTLTWTCNPAVAG